MARHTIITERTAAYHSEGELNKNTKDIWILIHGYGQLAEYFIRNFEILKKEGHFLVAPEGLSRFYLNGVYGRVGASWMTKESRLDEIVDQQVYFRNLLTKLKAEAAPTCRLHLIAFSQGVATAWRWLMDQEPDLQTLILWSGSLPNEMTADFKKYLAGVTVYYNVGLKDEYLTEELMKKEQGKLMKFIPHAEINFFDGGHSIDRKTLKEMKQKINSNFSEKKTSIG